MSEWIVSRSTPWPDGTPTVEIATDVDHLDPSLFWEENGTEYHDLTACGYDDPREAVRAAIRVRNMWQKEREQAGEKDDVVIGWANPFYPTTADPKTEEELISRANELWEAMPVCQHCGVKGVMSKYDDDAWGSFHACDEGCAMSFVWSLQEDDEEEESRMSSAPTAHVVTLTLAVRMDEMDGTPEQSAEIAACIVEEAIRQHWGGDAEVVAMTADYASPTPTRWPSVAADESVVWYCGADGSWGGCLAGDLLIIPERALTPDENAALNGVTSSRWDDEPGNIIAAAIERNAR